LVISKIENWDWFVERVKLICFLIISSIEKKNENLHVLSVDEKTWIHAIERYEQRGPKSRGYKKRKEYEYIRHGTTTLMATVNVENGKLFSFHKGQTRDENDYSAFIKKTVNKISEMDRVVILADQLNTHVSASLVKLEEYQEEELGEKGKSEIPKNMERRKCFWRDHTIE
jgi:hypothetical protein